MDHPTASHTGHDNNHDTHKSKRRRTDDEDEYPSSRPGRIRLKSSRHSSNRRYQDRDEDGQKRRGRHSDEKDHHHHHQRHRHYHEGRHRRRRDSVPENRASPPPCSPPVSPTVAFRESLFDALADDEGAAYWEGVYGQPIHTYGRPFVEDEEKGELERMTDEEYATYVRVRMWEKTHQGIIEERERRRQQAREAERERAEAYESGKRHRAETEREAFDRMVDESLRRGKERRTRKEKEKSSWLSIWKRYLDCWEILNANVRDRQTQEGQASPKAGSRSSNIRSQVVWPVEFGKREDITPDSVEKFLRNAPVPDTNTNGPDSSRHSNFLTVVKLERVRWHPDKIQHRYSVLGIDEDVIKGATEVFQILDQIWVNEQAKIQQPS